MSSWASDLGLDVRFAARGFAKRPGFAIVATLTLALGIGATTAVFSIVNGVLLRPLPYREPERLAAVWVTSTGEQGLAKIFATHGDYEEFRRRAGSFESMGAATWATSTGRVMTGRGPARELLTIPATASFFTVLGVSAAVGRTFLPEDERGGCSVVLAHGFWAAALGGDPEVVGKNLTLDEKPCLVVGVMPKEFSFYPRQTQAWVLLGPGYQQEQASMLVGIFGRVKRGVSLAQAEAELRSLYRAMHKEAATREFQPVVYDLQGEFTFLAGRTLRRTLWLVFAAVLLVLLTACLNVANLFLARISERRRELAVRAALGSGGNRLVRQVLTEGLLLGGAGTLAGIGMAWAAVRYFRTADPIELRVGAEVGLDPRVLGFCVLVSLVTIMALALLPAVRASRVDFAQHLKAAGRGTIPGRHRLSRGLVAVEVAFSFLLLMGAALFLTSALRMGSEELGFVPKGLVTVGVSLPASRYGTGERRVAAFEELVRRLRQAPGVEGLALGSKAPPEGGGNEILEIQGRREASGREIHDVGVDAVSPEFFAVMGMTMRRGRGFTDRDRTGSQSVAVINEALAAKYFRGQDPLGEQVRMAGGGMPWLTVVGVVGNVKHTQLMNEMSWAETPEIYRPVAQDSRGALRVLARSRLDAAAIGLEIQRQLMSMDPLIPVNEAEAVRARVSKALAYPRFRAGVFGFFAMAALLLAAVGLHGVLAQLVAQRIPEFGLRRAVGAQTGDLLWLVGRQGGVPVAAGLAAGVCMALVLGGVVTSLVYGMGGADGRAMAVAAGLLLGVAGVAMAAPAARAARVDPMVALREE